MIPKACHDHPPGNCNGDIITGSHIGLRVILVMAVILVSGCSGLKPPETSSPGPTQTMPPAGPWRSDIAVGRPISPPAGMSREQAIAEITSRSVLLLGTPYRLGGSRPDEGLDCSGLIFHVMNEAFRVRFPRTSEEQAMVGVSISRHEMAPGDLVFFNTNGRANSHVGVYLGGTRFIHAPTSRGVVRIESLSQGYWSRRFDQARRVIAER
jgi:cell wall-associated NlpC family hydrolase